MIDRRLKGVLQGYSITELFPKHLLVATVGELDEYRVYAHFTPRRGAVEVCHQTEAVGAVLSKCNT